MIRVVAVTLGLVALPFVLYAAYAYLTGRVDPERGVFASAPTFWLSVTGMVLAIGMLIWFAAFEGYDPGGRYVPAEIRDGQLVPGRIVPNEPDAAESPPAQ